MAKSKGLLAAYGIDAEEIEAPSYDIEDGHYEFVIGNAFIQHGTKANPDGPDSFVICYMLGDDGKEKREWYNLPEDPDNITEAEEKKLSFFVARMLDLGVSKAELNRLDEEGLHERIIGLSGTLELFTSKGKKGTKNEGKEFQNIRKVRVEMFDSDEDDDEDEEEEKASRPASRPRATGTRTTKRTNPFS